MPLTLLLSALLNMGRSEKQFPTSSTCCCYWERKVLPFSFPMLWVLQTFHRGVCAKKKKKKEFHPLKVTKWVIEQEHVFASHLRKEMPYPNAGLPEGLLVIGWHFHPVTLASPEVFWCVKFWSYLNVSSHHCFFWVMSNLEMTSGDGLRSFILSPSHRLPVGGLMLTAPTPPSHGRRCPGLARGSMS